jgi:hypothetical protein
MAVRERLFLNSQSDWMEEQLRMHAEIAELLTHCQPFLLLISLILAPEEDRNRERERGRERERDANAARKSTSHKLRTGL